jgi:hypothetical protein
LIETHRIAITSTTFTLLHLFVCFILFLFWGRTPKHGNNKHKHFYLLVRVPYHRANITSSIKTLGMNWDGGGSDKLLLFFDVTECNAGFCYNWFPEIDKTTVGYPDIWMKNARLNPHNGVRVAQTAFILFSTFLDLRPVSDASD